MKKKKCLVLGMFSVLTLGEIPKEETKVVEEPTIKQASYGVCETGNLNSFIPSTRNLLPPGFYGNHPDLGILEVGGTAGDPYGKEVPPMSMSSSQRYMMLLRFEDGIREFADANYLSRLGFVMEMETPDGPLIDDVRSTTKTTRLEHFFKNASNVDTYTAPERGKNMDTVVIYFPKYHAFTITFNYKTEWKLKRFRLYYSDVPSKIVNVSLYTEYSDPGVIADAIYSGPSCQGDYVKNVGSNPVYQMESQYGTVFSKDYLINSFLARDTNMEDCHPTIEDPQNYFSEGRTAPVGRKYKVYLTATDDYGNKSIITLDITVVDKRAPSITSLNSEVIRTSYATDFQSKEFYDQYFLISDNLSEDLDVRIEQENGQPIPEFEIGTFSAALCAKDENGNESKYPFTLELFDDIPPVIECEANEVILPQGTKYSREKLLSLFVANDEIDGECDLLVEEDEYIGNEQTIGSYLFSVKAEDSSGNVARKSITVIVQDSEGPAFYVKESFLQVIQGEIPPLEEILHSLIRQGVIENKNYPVAEVIQGEEIDNNLSLGRHQVTLRLVSEDGEEKYVHLTIEVVAKEKLSDSSIEKLTFWARFCRFWIDLWNKIVTFFTGKH